MKRAVLKWRAREVRLDHQHLVCGLIWCLNREEAKALACLRRFVIKDVLNRWQTEEEMKV